jgi:hypothetical protein
MVMNAQHPVVLARNQYGSIRVPTRDPRLCWLRIDRLQATCRAAKVEYADGLEGFEETRYGIKPLKCGVVIACRDVSKLVAAVARSSREFARIDAADILREVALHLVSPASVGRGGAGVVDLPALFDWCQRNARRRSRLVGLFRAYLLGDEIGRREAIATLDHMYAERYPEG